MRAQSREGMLFAVCILVHRYFPQAFLDNCATLRCHVLDVDVVHLWSDHGHYALRHKVANVSVMQL